MVRADAYIYKLMEHMQKSVKGSYYHSGLFKKMYHQENSSILETSPCFGEGIHWGPPHPTTLLRSATCCTDTYGSQGSAGAEWGEWRSLSNICQLIRRGINDILKGRRLVHSFLLKDSCGDKRCTEKIRL